jgi:hypothetical protein
LKVKTSSYLKFGFNMIEIRLAIDPYGSKPIRIPTFLVHSCSVSGKMNGNLASTSIEFFAIFSKVFVQNKYQLMWKFWYYFMYWYSILDTSRRYCLLRSSYSNALFGSKRQTHEIDTKTGMKVSQECFKKKPNVVQVFNFY